MSEWVGIDGPDNGSLIQAGVTEAPDPGNAAGFDVFAWWEVLAHRRPAHHDLTVSPGDEMR